MSDHGQPDVPLTALAGLSESARRAALANLNGTVSPALASEIQAQRPGESAVVGLVGLAASYAVAPISGFQVGAVVRGCGTDLIPPGVLYLGANMEFEGEGLVLGVHAEQAAIANAWMHDEERVDVIAVSSAPCGCCRQFLSELHFFEDLQLVLPGQLGPTPVAHLLPHSFGPQDLGVEGGLMRAVEPVGALRVDGEQSELLSAARSAAESSYAPYTGNRAGAAVETTAGRVFSGRYAENAAYNPSLGPLALALTMARLGTPPLQELTITGAALVETPTKVSQRGVSEAVLNTVAAGVELDYREARG